LPHIAVGRGNFATNEWIESVRYKVDCGDSNCCRPSLVKDE
jgi:hypothetical protein